MLGAFCRVLFLHPSTATFVYISARDEAEEDLTLGKDAMRC